jgi:hypothetical protein
MPRFYSKQLKPLLDELVPNRTDEAIQQNMMSIKEKIVPMLSMYASKTKDTGDVRDTISLFIHTFARLHTSTKESLSESLSKLVDYCRYELHIPSEKTNWMQQRIEKNLLKGRETSENRFFESFVTLLSENTVNNDLKTGQSVYKEIVGSLLMDSSVFSPFFHLFLPVEYQGHSLFTEVWIEKDFHGKSEKDNGHEQVSRLFLNFEIKSLGYFEVFIEYQKSNTSVHLYYPSTIQKSHEELENYIKSVFLNNGIPADRVQLSVDKPPQIPGRILQKVNEWRNIVNVSV